MKTFESVVCPNNKHLVVCFLRVWYIQYLDHLERFLAIDSSPAAIASRLDTDSFQRPCGLDIVCLSRGVDSAWLDCWRRNMSCMHLADRGFVPEVSEQRIVRCPGLQAWQNLA